MIQIQEIKVGILFTPSLINSLNIIAERKTWQYAYMKLFSSVRLIGVRESLNPVLISVRHDK